jgi:hypothetical protein
MKEKQQIKQKRENMKAKEEEKKNVSICLDDNQQLFSCLLFLCNHYLNRRIMNAYGELIELRFFFLYLSVFYGRSILLHAASAHH